MGGLIIKKAFILGQHIPEFQTLVNKVCAIFFLATPHRGMGFMELFSRILSTGPLQFVDDLIPESPALLSMIEEFPRYSSKILLFSFYETRSTVDYSSKLILQKSSAIMGLEKELVQCLDANHRDVAKFSSMDDPSYISFRNALASAVDAQ